MPTPQFDWLAPATPAAPPPEAPIRLEDHYPEEAILAAAGRIQSARRRTHGANAKRLPCAVCGLLATARERRRRCACCGAKEWTGE